MTHGLLSVIIPTHARDIPTLARAVQSVMKQDYAPKEVLVVDDNAVDSAHSEAVKRYCDETDGVTYVSTNGRGDACAARNLGAQASNGEFLGFLDDDDEWLEQKASLTIPLFEEGVGMVCSAGYTVVEDGEHTTKTPYDYNYVKEPTFQSLLRSDTVGTTTSAILSRTCFEDCGGFTTSLPARQDYELWLRIAKKYRIIKAETPLFLHYMHKNEQISRNPQKALDGLFYIYNEFKADYAKDGVARCFLFLAMSRAYRRQGKRLQQFVYRVRAVLAKPGSALSALNNMRNTKTE